MVRSLVRLLLSLAHSIHFHSRRLLCLVLIPSLYPVPTFGFTSRVVSPAYNYYHIHPIHLLAAEVSAENPTLVAPNWRPNRSHFDDVASGLFPFSVSSTPDCANQSYRATLIGLNRFLAFRDI